jgi:hypothetical protein
MTTAATATAHPAPGRSKRLDAPTMTEDALWTSTTTGSTAAWDLIPCSADASRTTASFRPPRAAVRSRPRPQRPSPGALPFRALQRQQRLDSDRVPGAQPRALDTAARPLQPHRARGQRPPAGDCSRSPAESPAPPGAPPCTSRRAGPGKPASSKRSPASERSPLPDRPATTHQHRAAPTAADGRPQTPKSASADTPPPSPDPMMHAETRPSPQPDRPRLRHPVKHDPARQTVDRG